MSGKFLENAPFNGFDGSGANPWQMVRSGGRKHLWLRVPKNASMWFKPFESPQATISFTGKTREAAGMKELEVRIDGLAAGPPQTFNAVSNSFQVPLVVEVLNEQKHRINLIRIRDKSGWTKRAEADFRKLTDEASKIFEYQANIRLEFHQADALEITDLDLGKKDQYFWSKNDIWNRLQKKVDQTAHFKNDVNVFCAKVWGALDDDSNCWFCQVKRRLGIKLSNVVGTHRRGNIIIEDNLGGHDASVLAHEIGHWFGFRANSSVHDEVNKDALMHPSSTGQKRLYRDHVGSIRKKTK